MKIADVLPRRKADVASVREVKWKGSKTRNIGHGYTLFYNGENSKRNGVGIILREEVLEISRKNGRIMLLKLICPCTKEIDRVPRGGQRRIV